MGLDSKYSIDSGRIDRQHSVFFDVIRTVEEAEAEGAPKNKIRRLVAEVMKYSEFHFLSEENIMIDMGYPRFKEHREKHKQLIRSLKSYIIKFESGKSGANELIVFLNDWLSTHTLSEDKLLAKHIDKAKK